MINNNETVVLEHESESIEMQDTQAIDTQAEIARQNKRRRYDDEDGQIRPYDTIVEAVVFIENEIASLKQKQSRMTENRANALNVALLRIKCVALEVIAETNLVKGKLDESRKMLKEKCAEISQFCITKDHPSNETNQDNRDDVVQNSVATPDKDGPSSSSSSSSLPGRETNQAVENVNVRDTENNNKWTKVLKKRKRKNARRKIMTKSIVISPTDGSTLQTSDDVRNKVKEIIKPSESNIKIHSIRDSGQKGIKITLDKDTDISMFTSNVNLVNEGLKAAEPEKRLPRIIIFDVSSNLSANEMIHCLAAQNNLAKESFTNPFIHGAKDKAMCNWVVDVKPDILTAILKKGKVYIDWLRCRVKEFVIPTRCFKCQGYGHISKYCRQGSDTCSHCSKTGHGHKDCPDKDKPMCCVNCKKMGKPFDHRVGSASCFAQTRAMRYLEHITDYDVQS